MSAPTAYNILMRNTEEKRREEKRREEKRREEKRREEKRREEKRREEKRNEMNTLYLNNSKERPRMYIEPGFRRMTPSPLSFTIFFIIFTSTARLSHMNRDAFVLTISKRNKLRFSHSPSPLPPHPFPPLRHLSPISSPSTSPSTSPPPSPSKKDIIKG